MQGSYLPLPLQLQPSQLFTLGASEHSPLKTPYFDAGVSCAEQVGAGGGGRQGWVQGLGLRTGVRRGQGLKVTTQVQGCVSG